MKLLIAREYHLEALSSVLRRSSEGTLKLVVLTGDPGVGKTTLLHAFADRAKRDWPELVVAGSKCHSVAGSQQGPYFPFVQIFQSIIEQRKSGSNWERLRRSLQESAPEWIALVPTVGGALAAAWRVFKQGGELLGGHGAQDLNRRIVQYIEALGRLSEDSPILIWIDDLHWADAATLNLLSALFEQSRRLRVMIVLTMRSNHLQPSSYEHENSVSNLLLRFRRDERDVCTVLPIDSFSSDELKQYLEANRCQVPESFSEKLFRRSGGNPLFVEQFLKLVTSKSVVSYIDGELVLGLPDLGYDIPDKVKAVIEQRLAILDEESRSLLALASIQGEFFSSALIARVIAKDELLVLRKLERLEQCHGLICSADSSQVNVDVGVEYRFVHILVQEYAYQSLPSAVRRRYHLSIACALQELVGDSIEAHAAVLASHFVKGESIERALHYYLVACRYANRLMALDDLEMYLAAMEPLAAKSQSEIVRTLWKVERLIQLANARYAQARFDDVLVLCSEGEILARGIDFAEQKAWLTFWRYRTLYALGRYAEGVSILRRAVDEVEHISRIGVVRGYLNVLLGDGSRSLYTIEEMNRALNIALEVAENLQVPELKAMALNNKAWIQMNRFFQPRLILEYSGNALEIARQYKLPYLQIESHRLIAAGYRQIRDHENALMHNNSAVEVSRQYGLARALHLSLYSLALSYRILMEDWRSAYRTVREAITIADAHGFPEANDVNDCCFSTALALGLWKEAEELHGRLSENYDKSYAPSTAMYLRQAADLTYARGAYSEAVTWYTRAIQANRDGNPVLRTLRKGIIKLAAAQLCLGEIEAARVTLSELDGKLDNESPSVQAEYFRILGQVALLSTDVLASIEIFKRALSLCRGNTDGDALWPSWPLASLGLAECLICIENFNPALEHARMAYELFGGWGHLYLAEAAFVYGQVEAGRGKTKHAVSLFDQAEAEWRRLGLIHRLGELIAWRQKVVPCPIGRRA